MKQRARAGLLGMLVVVALGGCDSGRGSSRGGTGGGTPAASGGAVGASSTGGTAIVASGGSGGGEGFSGASSAGGGSSAGAVRTGGVSATGGASAGGASATAGATGAGGTAAGGRSGTGTGGVASGGTTSAGSCDPGVTTTTWASNCPTAPPATCTAGTWVAGGPDPDHSSYTKIAESDHFAIYSNESVSSATAQAALSQLESIWSLYFGSPIFEREPLCNSSTKYKAAVHVNSANGLTGGAWDAQHMGMWIGPNALADHWGLAHEFMHGVQSVAGGMACGSGPNTCGWIYESHANWAAQQQPEYHTKDVHCSELLVNATHLYLGSTRDRYCNWQFMEYLKDKYCYSAVNAIWTGKPVADPFTAILNAQGWNIGQLNDFIGEWAMHNITWDYQDPPPESTAGGNQGGLFRKSYGLVTDSSQNTRRLRLTKVEPLDAEYASNRRFQSPFAWAPQRFGYNVIRLYPDAGATSVTVTFRGVTTAPASPDWRWGLVATDAGITTPRYSALQKGADAALTFCVKSDESLFLVVAATPSVQQSIVWDQAYGTVPRYPFMVQLGNAWPDGFQGGKPDACPSGTTRVSNGGGCGPANLPATVFVGPYALVTGSGVTGAAKIQDHAQVLGGKVADATVGALTVLGSSFSITGSATQAMTTFYPLDYFEGRNLTGGGLVGDVELRADHSIGTCSGFVDATTCTSPGSDSTPKPPYTWR
jgi:hypothetical protein